MLLLHRLTDSETGKVEKRQKQIESVPSLHEFYNN